MTSVLQALSSLDVDADSLVSRLEQLIAALPDDALLVGDLDLRELLPHMAALHHSDDQHHNGETILDHTLGVLQDVAPAIAAWPQARARRVRVAVMLHDLGKVATHAWNDRKQKHTFYNHHQHSVAIARRLLSSFTEDVPGDLGRLIDLVCYHDVFFQLAHARPAAGGTRYLRRFAAEPVSQGEALEELTTMARADSHRARARAETHREIARVVEDLRRFRLDEAQRVRAQEALEARKTVNLEARRGEIVALLEAVDPGLVGLLPDLRAVNARLGELGAFEVIRALRGVVEGEDGSA